MTEPVATEVPPSVYEIVNKTHRRTPMKMLNAIDSQGNTYVVQFPGEPEDYPVGTQVTDATYSEVTAFPDRFRLVSGPPLMPPPLPGQPAGATAPSRLNPEIFALMRRAQAGQATTDEQVLVGDIIAYLEKSASGTATAADVTALNTTMQEYGLTLFV